ncbi:MAG: type II 3-dehydroquinate dehydratase [Clostridia bacterium]|nr:type II 3-dehydroquinate dehydratase [Clostridia bacterium]
MIRLLLINGPNMNMLGIRQPEIYGYDSLDDIEAIASARAKSLGAQLECFQSNSEGAIITRLHEAYGKVDGILINPAAFTHYSYAIADAIAAVGIPTVEVHMSDINSRENFRKISVTAPQCIAQISGKGKESYSVGVEKIVEYITKEK